MMVEHESQLKPPALNFSTAN